MACFALNAFWCCVAVGVLCNFFMVLWIGMQSVIVAFPGKIQLLFIGKIIFYHSLYFYTITYVTNIT